MKWENAGFNFGVCLGAIMCLSCEHNVLGCKGEEYSVISVSLLCVYLQRLQNNKYLHALFL